MAKRVAPEVVGPVAVGIGGGQREPDYRPPVHQAVQVDCIGALGFLLPVQQVEVVNRRQH